jgi:hypothetical protein
VFIGNKLCDQFISTRKGKSPWSLKALVRRVSEIEHYDIFSSRIFAVEFLEFCPWQWTAQALLTSADSTVQYMVDVMAESHYLIVKLISYWFSTCLQPWQGKEVG